MGWKKQARAIILLIAADPWYGSIFLNEIIMLKVNGITIIPNKNILIVQLNQYFLSCQWQKKNPKLSPNIYCLHLQCVE